MFLLCGKFKLDLTRPLVMGIVNVTPDSFSDGGRYSSSDLAISHALKLIDEGADILDIGGESTRPGASEVSVKEEIDRVLPVIEGLGQIDVPLSIDTWKPEVMQIALRAGVSMVNDVNALLAPKSVEAVANSNAAVCLMHRQGNPQNMQSAPYYSDVTEEIMSFLQVRIEAALAAGIERERIVVDPGFGFGKTLEHNLDLLKRLGLFKQLAVPVLVGMSRKSMIGAITGQDTSHRLAGSVAAALLAVERGANIVRVHDVRETVDALKVWQSIQ